MTAMKAALPATMALSLPLIARPATAKAGRMLEDEEKEGVSILESYAHGICVREMFLFR